MISADLILAISAWCSMGMSSLSGSYIERMAQKSACQKEIAACIGKYTVLATKVIPAHCLSGDNK